MLKKTLITLTILAALVFTVAQLNVSIRDLIGTSLPATCTVGQRYFKTDATAGQNLYGCTSTNTWSVLGGGSDGIVLLEQKTASSSASLAFTSCLTSNYDTYQIEMVNIIPSTNATSIYLTFSTDGGSTYESTNYQYATYRVITSSAGAGGSTSAARIILAETNLISNASTNGLSGSFKIYNPLSTTVYKSIAGQLAFLATNTAGFTMHNFVGRWDGATAVNAFKFEMSSGNIASGTIRCYGIAK